MPPGQASVREVGEVVTVPTEALGLYDVTLGVVTEAESLHEDKLSVRYQVVTHIDAVGGVYQQQRGGVGGSLINMEKS